MRVLRCLLLIPAVAFSAFGQSYTINTFAGGGLPANIPATSASLAPVTAIAIDSLGDAFFTLVGYNVVLRRDGTTGILTVVAGNGTVGFSGDNGPATSAQLNNPTSVAVDFTGNVYVSDAGHAHVRKISRGIITTIAGSGSTGYGGDNGPATSAQLCPVAGAQNGLGLAVNAAGDLFIADTCNYRIRKVSNGVITTVVGTGISGFGGDSGMATAAQLSNPESVAVDSQGNLYIADGNRIRLVTAGVITTVAGTTVAGFGGDNGTATNAQLNGPNGIVVDSAGNLFIADSGNSRVREVSNGLIVTIAGSGTFGFSGDGGLATGAQLNKPLGVAVDALSDVFIADFYNDRVREVSKGVISTIAGGGSSLGDKGLAINAQLFLPGAAAVDSNGDVFIADSGNNRVRKVSNSTITTLAGAGAAGFAGDNGPAANAQLHSPAGVAVDPAGNVYIADSGNNRVRKVSNGVITTVAGNGTPGFSGDGGSAVNSQLSDPTGVAVDSNENLYIADYANNRIREVSAGVITTVAGNGTPGLSGDNGPAINAQVSGPAGVAVDAAGNLYIADSLNGRIRVVSGGVINTVAGSSGFALGDNGPATKSLLTAPQGVAVDAAGNLYIADTGDNRIRAISGGIINTIAGDGNGSFTGDGGPSFSAEVDSPQGLAVDPSGNLYLADTGNNRIRVMFPSGTSCEYAVSPVSFASVASSAGNLSVTIQSGSACHWAIQGPPDWIAFSGAATGTGPGSVTLAVAANSGAARSAIVSIAGFAVLVTQQGTGPALSITPGGVVNDASYSAPVAPGSIAAAFGDFLLASPASSTQSPLPFAISNLSLQFGGGTFAPLFFVSDTQVNFQVPWELAGQTQTTLTAILNNASSPAQTMTLAPVAPAIFTPNAQGTGQGSITDQNFRLVDSSNPAIAGTTYLSIYCTGLGAVTNQPATGSPASLDTFSFTTLTPVVTIGGVRASIVQFSGLAPGFTGLYQVNAQVPATSATGNAVPVSIYIGGATSNTVTIAVQ